MNPPNSDTRLAVVERDVAMLSARVDDYHQRLGEVERAVVACDSERARVERLDLDMRAAAAAIHALDLRLTSFTSRITTLGIVVSFVMPLLTALLMRWIGK